MGVDEDVFEFLGRGWLGWVDVLFWFVGGGVEGLLLFMCMFIVSFRFLLYVFRRFLLIFWLVFLKIMFIIRL